VVIDGVTVLNFPLSICTSNWLVKITPVLVPPLNTHPPSIINSTMTAPAIPTPNPPRNEAITTKELSQHSGQDPTQPIWVAVKGTVFDVSRNKDAYGIFPNNPYVLPMAWDDFLYGN
jgi:hypothetical protein